ncbi:hypothetical protein B0H13DRAFT_1898712 [Mycena leptocephala]|nr:hypothetical protein B0H13DRAFT_1898712 [Mycena leptocephala]
MSLPLPVGQSFMMHAPLDMGLLLRFPRHGAELNHGRTASKAWKVRLASTAGLPRDPEAQQKMKFLEILKLPGGWNRILGSFTPCKILALMTPQMRSPTYIMEWVSVAFQTVFPANKTLLKDWNKPEPENCGLVMERDANGTIVDAHFSSDNE